MGFCGENVSPRHSPRVTTRGGKTQQRLQGVNGRLWRSPIEPILAVIEGGETTMDVRNARALLAEIE
jgi:hypothetical protein